ncbi:MAG: GNAT family N-acetyltransferase, partial [Rhodospirillales bacterium]|nr:GNAT family N-acetyltransferase [Rhodospirillales bacterium]
TLECVTTLDRLAAVATPWHTLWRRAGADIFQHHAWVATWAADALHRRTARLRIMLAWEEGRLVAILPCAVLRWRGLRVLQWAAQDFSDYCDALVDPDTAWPATLNMLWEGALARGGIDLLQMHQIRPDARARRILVQDGNGLHLEDRHDRCLRIDCQWPTGEAYFRSLNKKGRNNHTRGKRIIEEIGGPVRFRCLEPNEDHGPAIDRLIALKQAWLRANDPRSPLLDAEAPLLRAMMQAALATELGKLFVLEAGNTLVTGSLNFLYETKMQAYMTAYDPAFDRASPGTILIVEYAKWAFDRGLRQVDFLRGDETFKFRLGNAETLLDRYLGARSLVGHAAVNWRHWRHRLRAAAPPAPAVAMAGVESHLDEH